ncbi:MAG TPA: hypothetical protein VNJ01_03620 [Bacteriovoracaceae bacterium]|nr:hypothetical protein [Bacteriovoracaceae bacterium]
MKYLNFLALLILLGCSTGEVRKDLDDGAYRTSGVEQFFLAELPAWANFSAASQCVKGSSFQYLNFPKLASAYQLNYLQLIELQAQYNERLEDYFRSTSKRFLKPVEESAFFSNTLEQVRGGIRSLKIPSVREVDVVWVDDVIFAKKIAEFKSKVRAGRYDRNPTILFSSCFTKQGLVQWMVENDLEEAGFFSLSAEWLSPFGSDLTPRPALSIEIKKILSKDIKVNLEKPYQLAQPPELIL